MFAGTTLLLRNSPLPRHLKLKNQAKAGNFTRTYRALRPFRIPECRAATARLKTRGRSPTIYTTPYGGGGESHRDAELGKNLKIRWAFDVNNCDNALVTIFGGLFSLGRWIYKRLCRHFIAVRPLVPKSTLVVQPIRRPGRHRDLWWFKPESGGKPTLEIIGNFSFTTLLDGPVVVSGAELLVHYKRWGFFPTFARVWGEIAFDLPGNRAELARDFRLLRGQVARAMVYWFVDPALASEGKTIRAQPCFLDQFGNRHWLSVQDWVYFPRE